MRKINLRPWNFTLLLAAAYLIVVFFANNADPKTFVTIGNCYSSCHFNLSDGCPTGTKNGYDGQYAYYIARDPGHSGGCMDVAAYRYQRILLPMIGYVLSFGITDLIPVVFVLVNLAALVISTALLEQLLVEARVSRWYALVYSLFFGVFASVRLSTTEPLAYGLAIVAIWLHQRKKAHPWLEAVIWLAAVMTKEMVMVFVAGVLLYYLLQRRWLDIVRLAGIVGIPFVLWQIYLYHWLGAFGVGSGGGGATPFEIIPFNGIWRIWTDTGNFAALIIVGSLGFFSAALPAAWGIWNTVRDWLRTKKLDLYTAMYLMNALVLVFVPFSTYREYLGILRFIVGLVLAHLLYAAVHRRKRPLLYSTLWVVLSLFLVGTIKS